MRILLVFLTSLYSITLFAQIEKTIHQTFTVTEAQQIEVNLPVNYEFTTWPGDAILVETNIKLEQATTPILNYAIENGRYQVTLEDKGGGSFLMSYKNPSRQKLKTKFGECTETVTIRIFVPEQFDQASQAQLIRKIETTKE